MPASDTLSPAVLLALATALHLGFQTVVTLLVYPALAEAAPFPLAHERHSRRIAPVVGVVYGLLLLACALRLRDPLDAGTLLAYAGSALALLTTAVAAAPTHGRLAGSASAGRPVLLRTLLRADRIRFAGTLLAAVGALFALA